MKRLVALALVWLAQPGHAASKPNIPNGIDGISFLPTLLQQGRQKQHDYLYWEFHELNGRVAIRKGNWKGVRYNVAVDPNSPLELYDRPKPGSCPGTGSADQGCAHGFARHQVQLPGHPVI